MTEREAERSAEEIPEAVVESGHGFSAIWLVPLVAIVIAGSLLFQDLRDRGEVVEVSFGTAEGVEAGTTTVRYRDVVVGTVQTVRLSDDLSHIVIVARMTRDANQVLVEGTRFWVERPRIGPHGISGLTTIVSGAYLALDPGDPKAKKKSAFVGLTEPPQNLRGEAGLRVSLTSEQPVRGLSYGASVLLEGIDVGRVTRLDLRKKGEGVDIEITIDEVYQDRVHANTRFWNISGVEMTAGLHGIDFEAASLESVLAGGISFGTPGPARGAAKDGDRFVLFSDRKAAFREYEQSLGLQIAVRARDLGSIADGDAVLYRGIPVGRVLRSELAGDARHVLVHLQIDSPFAPLVRTNSVFWNASGASADLGLTGLHLHMDSLESVLAGAVEFATPNDPGSLAERGAVFKLAAEAKDAWLRWSPEIPIGESP